MNKYQEALNEFVGYIIDNTELFDNVAINEYLSKRINTLQELIDNYSKIQQFDRAIYFNADGVVVNGISYEQLEKALDKACIELWYFQDKLYEAEKKLYALGYDEYAIPKDIKARNKEQWKEWCLKDE